MVTVISDELLKDLNNGKVINLEIAGLGFSLASHRWVEKQEKLGNIARCRIMENETEKEQLAKYDGYYGFDSWDCPKCGKDVTDKPNFCPKCGVKLRYERHHAW